MIGQTNDWLVFLRPIILKIEFDLYLYLFKYVYMKVANFSEFRSGLKDYLDGVEEDNETLIIKRKTGKGTVLISLDEYNSIMETLHLLSSRKNAERLYQALEEEKNGQMVRKSQSELDAMA